MSRKRLGRRERAAVKELRRLALERAGKVQGVFAVGYRRSMWSSHGVPFVKPGPRPWEYNGYTARRINRVR